MGANVTTRWMGKSIPQNIESCFWTSAAVEMYRAMLEMNVAVVAGLCQQPYTSVVRLRALWFGGWGHWVRMREMSLLFPAQTLVCFITAQIISPSALRIEIARHRTAQILGCPDTSAGLSCVKLYFCWVFGWCWSAGAFWGPAVLLPVVPMIVGASGELCSLLSVVLCPTASLIPSSLGCCHPSDRRAQSFTEEMCILLIATSVGGYFTWMLFLLVCFLSSWPQPVSVPSFWSQPSLYAGPQEDPYPCLVKQAPNQTLSREICCNRVSWDQLYQLYPPYDILSCSHKNEVAHLVHFAATLTWRLMQSFSFFLEEALYLFCPAGFAAGLVCWPNAGADVAVQALLLCAFQSIVGNFEAVPFLRWHFRVCRLTFISMSFAHCSSIHLALCVEQKHAEIQEALL